MLKPEQAELELKKVKVEVWQKNAAEALGKLPEALRKVARPLIGIDDNGKKLDYWKEREERAKVTPVAKEMTAAQRMKLFQALFPKFPEVVEAGWQLLERLPYQSGYEIKPFRALSDSVRDGAGSSPCVSAHSPDLSDFPPYHSRSSRCSAQSSRYSSGSSRCLLGTSPYPSESSRDPPFYPQAP